MDEQDPNKDAAWLPAARAYWDAAAPGFDAEPDHGLHDPAVRQAWAELLRAYLPPPPASVLDLGCGTGSLTVLLAALGHAVTGLDFSGAMIALAEAKADAEAQAKAAGAAPAAGPWHRPQFHVMNAAEPTFAPRPSTYSCAATCCGRCPPPPRFSGAGPPSSSPAAGCC